MRPTHLLAAAIALALAALPARAADLFIDNARVHTAGPQGTLARGDVLVRDGLIAAVGAELAAPAGVPRIDAQGQPLTPGLFAGLTALGLMEINAERTTVHNVFGMPIQHEQDGETRWRPEFDVMPAFNPRSSVIPVNRKEGLTFSALTPAALQEGSFVTGQGGVVRLHGGWDSELDGGETLYIDLRNTGTSGGSRASQYMLLEQAIREARPAPSPMMMAALPSHGLLTPGGRDALARFLRGGRVVFFVDRAVDILHVLRLSERHGFRPVIAGATGAWQVAPQLAASGATVIVDPLQNLPMTFDQLDARLDNAALLRQAGVRVAISQFDDLGTHNARKIRQLAGNAVANGMAWEDALKAITAEPARAFGVADRVGSIEVGKRADLVLWNGDPLDVTTTATAVFMDGRNKPLVSRQTLLRDRYMGPPGPMPRQYPQATPPAAR
ncbi:MAG: amidohydrolase family protein [Xanthomonadaceae bacterium]|nr:amidohydrolase family protein [Xanthomonadaceae bacterium]